jgi:DNA ligase-1
MRENILPRGTLPVLKKQSKNGVIDWEIWVELTNDGYGCMVTKFGLHGGKKQTLREVIKKGKNEGHKNETTPYQQAVLEATSRWNKQKDRKGYGLTAEESAGIRSASPMLAQVYEKQAGKVQWETAYAQPKLDGYRCLARKVGKKITLTSRENQPMPALVHIADILKDILEDGVTVDGEMYNHGLSLNQIGSACKKKSSLSEQIQYHIYDMVSADDFAARHSDIHCLFNHVRDPRIHTVETVKVRTEADLMVCQKEFIAEGYEGAMLRHSRAGYEAGKRSANLLKVKTFKDADFKIIDWKLGRGKYANVPIFTCVTKEGNEFDAMPSGTMEERAELADKAATLIGKKAKVKYLNFTKTEMPVPFHPVVIAVAE